MCNLLSLGIKFFHFHSLCNTHLWNRCRRCRDEQEESPCPPHALSLEVETYTYPHTHTQLYTCLYTNIPSNTHIHVYSHRYVGMNALRNKNRENWNWRKFHCEMNASATLTICRVDFFKRKAWEYLLQKVVISKAF